MRAAWPHTGTKGARPALSEGIALCHPADDDLDRGRGLGLHHTPPITRWERILEYDVIVIGSGAAGGWVAKETAEGGCRTLMLEAGRALDPKADFPTPREGAQAKLVNRVKAMMSGQHVQARCMSFKPATAHLFINDHQNPYTLQRAHNSIGTARARSEVDCTFGGEMPCECQSRT